MSSANGMNWVTPALAILVGGMLVYTIGRGSCPANSSRSQSPVAVTDPQAVADGQVRLIHADESTFDAVALQSPEPVLVDFYADWCGPCQMLAPTLDRVADKLTNGRIVKVNVDQSPDLAARYQVRSIPTLLLLVDGKIVERHTGILSEREITNLLQVN